jgi:hypothetical protein
MIFFFKRFEKECIRKLTTGYRFYKFNERLTVIIVIVIILFINLVYVYISIYEGIFQFNRFTWWGWCWIFVGFPPTIRPPSVDFVVLKGTPEMFTEFYNTNSNSCTCSTIRRKSVRIFCYFLSPHFIYAFPQHAFLSWYFGLHSSG